MKLEPSTLEPAARPGITLTQVLSLDRRLSLYGNRITDLVPRGDLGLGLDPEGPVGFALVRGYRRGARFNWLPVPLVLSVFGDGQPPAADDDDARAGERIWTVAAADRALQLQLQQCTLAALLQPAAGGRRQLGSFLPVNAGVARGCRHATNRIACFVRPCRRGHITRQRPSR